MEVSGYVDTDELRWYHRLLLIAILLGGLVYCAAGMYGAVRFYERHVLDRPDCVKRSVSEHR
jgi:hypothetical protein